MVVRAGFGGAGGAEGERTRHAQVQQQAAAVVALRTSGNHRYLPRRVAAPTVRPISSSAPTPNGQRSGLPSRTARTRAPLMRSAKLCRVTSTSGNSGTAELSESSEKPDPDGRAPPSNRHGERAARGHAAAASGRCVETFSAPEQPLLRPAASSRAAALAALPRTAAASRAASAFPGVAALRFPRASAPCRTTATSNADAGGSPRSLFSLMFRRSSLAESALRIASSKLIRPSLYSSNSAQSKVRMPSSRDLRHDRLELVELALEDALGDGRRVEQDLDRRRAALAVLAPHQPLRDDRAQVRRQVHQQLGAALLGEEIDDALDRLARAVGVQRAEAQVAGLGERDRVLHRLGVADLADQDHVGRLAQRVLQRVVPRVRVDADLAVRDQRQAATRARIRPDPRP